MTPRLHQYTVTQLRLGATCPRVHYFDSERARRTGRQRLTLLWKEGGVPAGGALFHRSVERFTRLAGESGPIRDAIERAPGSDELHRELGRWFAANCLDRGLASRPVELQRGFSDALYAFLRELAVVASWARASGVPGDEVVRQLFGDPRKRVDVTFDVLDGHQVRVIGAVDYVFYDWRTRRHRIFDYKLAPSHSPHGDLVQVSAYALMHDRQHGTRPDVAVYYLHPERSMVEKSWEAVWEERAEIYDYLASMIAWEAYDEETGTGLLPPGVPSLCGGCPWRGECERRLGPKEQGERVTAWSDRSAGGDVPDPSVAVGEPPEVLPEPEVDEEEDEAGDAPPGLWIGSAEGGAPVILPTATLNTHVAVVGAAGSGKTWTAKVIAEEAVRNGIPVIAIDPQGDLVQFLRRRERDAVPAPLRAAYDAFVERVEPRIYTPGTSHAVRLSLDPIRLPQAADLAAIDDPDRRVEEEQGLLQACAVTLASLALGSGDRTSQETFLLQILRGVPRDRGIALADVVRYVRDPDQAGIDDPDALITPASRRTLGLRLNALVHGPSAALFSGGLPLDLDAMVAASADGRVPLNVIYLNALTDETQKQFFVASLASELYRWMITRASAEGGRTSVLFYLDEARDYLPAGAGKPMAKGPLLRLFTQGRKYGVGCLICTQSPRSVDYNAFGNCSTKIVGRLESAQDVDRVREWFATDGTPPWLDARKGAAKGSFVGRWPDGDGDTAFRGRELFSAHEGAWSPDRVEREFRSPR